MDCYSDCQIWLARVEGGAFAVGVIGALGLLLLALLYVRSWHRA